MIAAAARRRPIPAALLVALVGALALGGCLPGREAPAPRAHRGLLDLSSFDLEQGRPLGLDGEWELYWNRLLTPEELRSAAPAAPSGFLSLPSSWNDAEIGGHRLGSKGFATFRLKLLLGAQAQPRRLALRLFNVNAAYALWVDGRRIGGSGVVSPGPEGEVALPSDQLARFQADGGPHEIVLQVSNHAYRAGGALASIELGTEEAMEDARTRRQAGALFFIACLLTMGLYHLAFFSLGRQRLAMACFGAYCVLWASNFLTCEAGGWLLRLVLPSLSSRVADAFASTCFYLSIPVGYQFFRALYPAEFSARLPKVLGALAAVHIAFALAPAWVFSWSQPPFYLTALLSIGYTLARLERARRRGREGAAFILGGFAVLGLSGANDMLKDVQLLETSYWMPWGMLALILSQAAVLARLFSHTLAAREQLAAELTDKNQALEAEMAERRRLEREIVRTSEAERRRLSHALHDGLCQLLTGARLRCAALEARLHGTVEGAQELSRLSAMLEESVSHAYDLSRGLWPEEEAATAPGLSLEELGRRFASSGGFAVEVHQEVRAEEVGAELWAQLHRIANEALTNAAKHAHPARVEVSLQRSPPGWLTLTVRDDGVGRAVAARPQGGLGLRIVAHRAAMLGGTLAVSDGADSGTVVTCSIPDGSDPGSKSAERG